MRAQEFTLPSLIAEVAMTPKALQQMAAQIPAQAGMEFEMYVPGAGTDDYDDDRDLEPDYNYDTRVRGFEEIIDFFTGDENSRIVIRRLKDDLEEEFQDWRESKLDRYWDNHKEEIIEQYLIAYEGLTGDELHDRVNELADDDRDRLSRTIRSKFFEDPEEYDGEEPDRDDWAMSEFRNMSDVADHYDNLTWPYWTRPDPEPRVSIDKIADEFQQAIGRPVNASEEYHKARREPGHYVVEPDGSLDEPDSTSDRGLEFVSPALSIADLFSDLKKVQAWANRIGCYTNESTGLHINVSIKNADVDNLDYVKLALLLGDQYILEQFNRAGNHFCKSAIEKIQKKAGEFSEAQMQSFMNKMKSGLDQLASRFIVNPETVDKYTSIHPKQGYIEFRSPGGDWLDDNFDKIENTTLRMVVALDAAYDPQKYRKEYLKKLSKVLNPSGQTDAYGDMIAEFNKYVVATGGSPSTQLNSEQTQALKDFRRAAIEQLRLSNQTQAKKTDAASGELYWWRVIKGTQNINVVAYSAYEAKQKAAQEWREDWRNPIVFQMYSARPIKPYQGHGEQSEAANYEIIYQNNITVTPRPVFRFSANNDAEARRKYADWLDGAGIPSDTREYGYRRIGLRPGEPTSIRWRILINGEQVFELDAANQGEANAKAREWFNQRSPEFLRAHQGGEVEVVPKNIQ